MLKLYYLLFALKTATCNCSDEYKNGFERTKHKISRIGEMPIQVNESSGLEIATESEFWTHNDSGGEAKLYKVTGEGKLLDSLEVAGAKNVDWEEITQDGKGNLYVGDFGNNRQSRKDLTIYKISGDKTERITFRYADQTAFPANPPKFDCEAFFWYQDRLYIFTKNYTKKNHVTQLYAMPDKAGDYEISPKGRWEIDAMVTAADISPDGKEFALLTYGKVLVFNVVNGNIDFSSPKTCFKTHRKQTEAIIYTDEKSLIFSNEQQKIYRLSYK
jgi:Tol biopolymer transport system component